jgi:hypothetical protein
MRIVHRLPCPAVAGSKLALSLGVHHTGASSHAATPGEVDGAAFAARDGEHRVDVVE